MKSKKKIALTKSNDREYINLRKRIRLRVNKINSLNDGSRKKGWKSKRSILYKELVSLNFELKKLSKERGYDVPVKKAFVRKRKFNIESRVITYMDKVWTFESVLRDKVISKSFKSFYFKNLGKVYYVNTAKLSTILNAYDAARNEAYEKKYSQTPYVEITEDEVESRMTIYIYS